MRATICLPTYDERENLEPMIRALAEVLRPGDRVLVVDDSSPDGTGAIADGLAAELDFVGVLHRERKEGLGPAYIAGFRWALEREPLPLETSLPGVFVAGDVRRSSMKRVASAVGEGSVCIQLVHRALQE